jgi:hypothetical protein
MSLAKTKTSNKMSVDYRRLGRYHVLTLGTESKLIFPMKSASGLLLKQWVMNIKK